MASPIIESALAAGRPLLNEVEAKTLLQEAGVPVTATRLAATVDEAVEAATELGYPVVLKVIADSIIHKSDVGGVVLGLVSEDAVRSAWAQIHAAVAQAAPAAELDGVSVQPMAEPGTEVIVGLTRDPQFGPVVMFGLGGVFVELMEDVAFRVVPLEPRDAHEMIREIQGFPMLDGFRGRPTADLAAIESLLLQISEFAQANPEVHELDLNPVFAYESGALAVDARVVLASEA